MVDACMSGCLVSLCCCLWREGEPQRQIICNLETSFQKLIDERASLIATINAWKEDINDAEGLGMKATDILTRWLGRAEEMEVVLDQILGPEDNPKKLPEKCLSGCCYANLQLAYKLGKEVADNLSRAERLLGETLRDFVKFSPAPIDDLPVEQTFGLNTEFNDLLHHLDQPGQHIIRVYGMGGVGKTALMKKIHNQFLTRAHDFNLIIWVDASTSSDILSIQHAVGSKLSWQRSGDTRQHARATHINGSLKKRRFLLFIDNPGKEVTLTDVGIPIRDNHNSYKVVFSTTDESMSLGLGGGEYVTLQVNLLQWADAWNLFKQAVGEEALLASNADKAKNIAGLCGGLPLTLVTVGRAMSSKRDPADWEHAEEMLMKFDPKIVNMEAVYKRFLVTYNGLNTSAQSCFLYCSLFPRDYLVRKEELLNYWLGENLLTEAHKLKAHKLKTMRSQGEEIISTLSSACLLEKSGDDNIIRMHNTVRGSALWISTSCGERKDAVWVESRVDLPELPTTHLNWDNVERVSLMHCKINKLNRIATKCSRLLTLILRHSIVKEISVGFFQAMSFLKVLDLSRCEIIIFPSEITLLTELQYLNMSHNHISVLPRELEKLTRLKFLDLSFIPELQQIPGGVMKSLTNLLVLNMYSSGYQHRKKGGVLPFSLSRKSFWGGTSQTLFEELKSLNYLQDLRISVNGSDSLDSLRGSAKLNCIHSLFITKYQESLLFISQMENLKVFRVYNCPQLENLEVNYVNNLTHVEIELCWALTNLTWLRSATNLQSLKVVSCINMVAIISGSGSGSGSNVGAGDPFFSSLRSLYLDNLPALNVIYERNLPFKCLEEIMVHSCPNLYELPLTETAAGSLKLKVIRGHERWWRDLRMDEAVKDTFRVYFRSSET